MSKTGTCPKCGAELTGAALGGLCPKCVAALALATEPETQGTVVASLPVTEKPGDRIGHYRLLQQIGEGGCGVVYMAQQEEPVRRQVALKIIKLGMDTRSVIGRFEAERQALALMDHPNIAKVFDAGATATGRPFFVMELVRGIKITDYCDENQLATRERLDLFVQVCHAIQHAHQKGIIHRDIKPSNILVTLRDGVPVPKVIDFGIAKATTDQLLTDKTVFTEFRQFLGTPAYMSPEQAEMSELGIDTRSDIYSLGILLYELLTGKTPFEAKDLLRAGLDEIRRIIREKEPPKPSTRLSTMLEAERTDTAKHRQTDLPKLIHLVRGDLDWIVMKALEKDRTRRYETANGFAMDLRRHLADEPVTAHAPSAGYKFRKFARRNKVAFAVAVFIAAVLVLATSISVWQAIRATRAEALAKERLNESEAITKFLTEVFRSPDPARDGRTITVAETLATAVKKLETDLAGQPARQATLRATLGWTYYGLGLYPDAIPLQEKARDYYLANSSPETPATLHAMHNLALSYSGAGRRDEAIKLQEEVLTRSRKVLDPEHPGTLMAMNNLALTYSNAGRRDEALALQEEVLMLRRKVSGPEHPDTLLAMGNLSVSYFDNGRRDEALKLREEVLVLRRKVSGPEHPFTIWAMGNLALSYRDLGRRDVALKLYEEAVPLSRKVNGPVHPGTLSLMNYLATSYSDAGRLAEALKLREEVLPLMRKVNGLEHSDTLWAMNNLAVSYSDAGRVAEGLKLREEVLPLMRKVNNLEHPATLAAMQNLAESYLAAGRVAEGIKLQEEVLTLRRKVLVPEHPDTLWAMNNLASSYFQTGRRDEALKLFEEAVTLSRKVRGPEHLDTLMAMIGLGISYRDAGRADAAIKLGQSSLELYRRVLGSTNGLTLNAMTELAISYQVAHRTVEAITLEEESLRLKRQHLPRGHPWTLESLESLATGYEQSNRKPEAKALRQELAELKAKAGDKKSSKP